MLRVSYLENAFLTPTGGRAMDFLLWGLGVAAYLVAGAVYMRRQNHDRSWYLVPLWVLAAWYDVRRSLGFKEGDPE